MAGFPAERPPAESFGEATVIVHAPRKPSLHLTQHLIAGNSPNKTTILKIFPVYKISYVSPRDSNIVGG